MNEWNFEINSKLSSRVPIALGANTPSGQYIEGPCIIRLGGPRLETLSVASPDLGQVGNEKEHRVD